jgi:transcriptional regulator with XRE-family HTH domain
MSEAQSRRILAGLHPLLVWRERRGVSQIDLKRKSGIPVAQIDRIERGVSEMKRSQAIQLAAALEITLSDLEVQSARSLARRVQHNSRVAFALSTGW